MILSGDPIPAKDALALGLVDAIFEGDLAAAGGGVCAPACWRRSGRSAACATATTSSRSCARNPQKFGEIAARM